MPAIATTLPHLVARGTTGLAVLAVGAVLTFTGWRTVSDRADAESTFRRQVVADRAVEQVRRRLRGADLLASAAVGLADAGVPDQATWSRHAERLLDDAELPGVLGLAFVEAVAADARDALVARERAAGRPDFDVRPMPGQDPRPGVAFVITRHAPEAPNAGAIGRDLATLEPTRAALERARDRGAVTLCEPIRLAQQATAAADDSARGIVLYRPVGDAGGRHLGWIAVPIDLGALLAAAAADAGLGGDLTLLDPAAGADGSVGAVVFGGRRLALRADLASGVAGVDAASRLGESMLVVGGSACTVLLAGLVHVAVRTRRRAAEEAERLLGVARRHQACFVRLATAVGDCLWELDADGTVVHVTSGVRRQLGHAPGDLLDRAAADLVDPGDRRRAVVTFLRGARSGTAVRDLVVRMRTQEGAAREIALTFSPECTPDGRCTGWRGTARDVTVARRLEASLAGSQAMLEQTSRLTRTGGWEIDLRTGERRWTAETLRIHGLSPGDEFSEETALAHYPDPDRLRISAAVTEIATSGTPFDLETAFVDATGLARRVRTAATAVRDERGRIVRIVGYLQDVTDAWQRDERRREAEASLRIALDAARAASCVHDFDTGEATWDERMFRLLGLDTATATPSIDLLRRLAVDGDRDRLVEAFRTSARTGDPLHLRYRVRRPDGTTCTLETQMRTTLDEHGRPVQLAGLTWDVSARAEAEAETSWLWRVVDESPTEVHVYDAGTGRAVRLNGSACAALGHAASADEPLHVWDVLAGHDEASFRALVGPLRSGDLDELRLEAEFRRGDGTTYPVDARLRCDAFRGDQRLVVFASDVTDRVRSEEALKVARDAAVSANRAKSDFLANMSHEIRTPMTAILGFAELLDDPELDDAMRDAHVATIRRNGEHLLALVNDVLDLSKIESGRMELSVEAIEVRPLLQDVVDLVALRAREKGIDVELRIDADAPCCVRADAMRLRQILVNLAGNAVKFTECGFVRLSASATPDGGLELQVRDTGIGMTPEQIGRIFRPFTQADESTTRRFGGTGLGLAISRRLAVLMDASIDCSSSVGRGSVFTVRFEPASLAAGAACASADATADAAGAPAVIDPAVTDRPLEGLRVLVVEDGPDNQRLLRHLLERAGAEVEIEADGRAGVDRILDDARPVPDVVLMDMQMPVMDGYEATRTLRDRGLAIPIVALTAHAMAGDRRRCLAAGCDDHVGKPVDRRALVVACLRHVRSRPAA